ncbi:HNH endonuclease [Lactobacillus delbrueckii subsp. bulgaricus]|uniref:HNH endonuclease n=1 Tax=Lactobacillus delbrueckii TaxID=1584 RepID=UPI0035CEA149|nr:HNH endonuclease [Lactobacillus delbrueckii subsp. bulgaricus]MCT3470833.1 HNH endonuclease [Lactobacillus delbrueckii subsp. bulgaricus]
MVTLSREELIKQTALLHRQHILHGYPKGQRPKISKAKRKRIYVRDKGICAYCGKRLEFKPNGFHIDHIRPLAKGGNNEDSNLTVSCRECNLSKHTQTVRPIYARGEYVGTLD